MKTGIRAMAHYLPGEVLNVREHYGYLGLSPQHFDSAPDTVHRLKDASALELMALSAAERAMDASGLSPDNIDGLLVAQTGGKQFMPLLASYLQLNLGLGTGIVARNVHDNNVSVANILNLARVYLESGICTNILVVASAAQIGGKYGFGADLTDPLCVHLGDGAAAAIMSSGCLQCELLGYHMETFAVSSRKTGTLNADYGTVRLPLDRELCFAAEMDDKYGAYLELGDPQLDAIAGASGFLSGILERGAKKAGLTPDGIDYVISCHQGRYLDVWAQDLPGNERLLHKQKSIGNVGCADTLLDLSAFAGAGMFRHGDVIALWSVCKGVQAALVLLRWCAS